MLFFGNQSVVFARTAAADAEPVAVAIETSRAESILAGILGALKITPKYSVVSNFHELPTAIQQDAYNQNSGEYDGKGIFHKGTLYLVVGHHSTRSDFRVSIFQWLVVAGLNKRPIGQVIGLDCSIGETLGTHGFAIICTGCTELVCRTASH